jgi:hypothetical protein
MSHRQRVLPVRFSKPLICSRDCVFGAATSTLLWGLLLLVYSRGTIPPSPPEPSLAPLDVTATAAVVPELPDLSASDVESPPLPTPVPRRLRTTSVKYPAAQTTHMRCYAHGDESELCVYENALCFDGTQVVVAALETTDTYKPKYDTRVPDTASCYDYRHYEPSAPEYTGCKYLPLKGHARRWRDIFNASEVSSCSWAVLLCYFLLVANQSLMVWLPGSPSNILMIVPVTPHSHACACTGTGAPHHASLVSRRRLWQRIQRPPSPSERPLCAAARIRRPCAHRAPLPSPPSPPQRRVAAAVHIPPLGAWEPRRGRHCRPRSHRTLWACRGESLPLPESPSSLHALTPPCRSAAAMRRL